MSRTNRQQSVEGWKKELSNTKNTPERHRSQFCHRLDFVTLEGCLQL